MSFIVKILNGFYSFSFPCFLLKENYVFVSYLLHFIRLMKKGLFIVVDGTDWSWKKTQTDALVTRLSWEWYEVEKIDFPQYGKPSAGPTEQYLNWKFWSADDVSPYQASILYAVDRFSAANTIRKWLDEWKIVISDRYVSANMWHQAWKISDLLERDKFLEWLENLEYWILNIPRPDVQVFLYLDPEISRNLALKVTKPNMDKTKDVHENDANHMRKASEAFLYVAEKFKRIKIDCAVDWVMRTREDIWAELYDKIQSYLSK